VRLPPALLTPLTRRVALGAAVVLVSLAVKLAYLEERRTWPDFRRPTLDARYHDDWARGLSGGPWTGRISEVRTAPYFRAPLYPYFVAAVYRLLGHDYYRLRLVQIAIAALTSLLLFLIVQSTFDTRTGWIALLLYLGYWPVTHFDGEILLPVLVLFLDALLLGSLLVAARKDRPGFYFLSGTLLGLSAVTRPNILIVVPAIVLWLHRGRGDGRVQRTLGISAALLAGMMLAVLPVTVRNRVVGHDQVLIASQGGLNFYIGNNPHSNGLRAAVHGARTDWWGGYDDTNRMAEEAEGRSLRPSEISRFWYGRGLSFLVSEPLEAMRLYGRKLALLLGSTEISNNRELYFRRDRSRVLSALPVSFGLLLGLSTLGLLFLLLPGHSPGGGTSAKHRRLERLLPHYLAVPYAVSILLFFVTSRYRLPVAFLLVPPAAHATVELWSRARKRRMRSVLSGAGFVTAVVVLGGLNPFDVGNVASCRGLYNLGHDLSGVDPTRAVRVLTRAVHCDPTYAPSWKVRGRVHLEAGRYKEALEDLTRACRLDRRFASAFFLRGVTLQEMGLHLRALPDYERVLDLNPRHVPALTNLADIRMRQGHLEKAYPLLVRALHEDPLFENAIYGLGYFYEQVGARDAAIEQYARIPDFPPARLRLAVLLERPVEDVAGH
jgi:tetratricopeptide (TPR) repeat protein